ncbi:MAG: NAD(P)H-dependent glycerol-3-phosphate dehydrogenase [Acidimicrobiia bacterium]|nr:NAD(P)H-dependent glycerol-3-phosphate dehydrogenase [Acidimicrobiia bacterium]
MNIRVVVVGAGSWGTTVASLAAKNTQTTVWARRPDLAAEIHKEHSNSVYLPGYELTDSLRASADLADVVSEADVLVMAVPSHGFRSVLEEAADHVRPWVPVVSLTKGLEQGSNLRMTEIVAEVLPEHPAGVLTGPNLAKEILAGDAAAAVVALEEAHIAEVLQRVFSSDLFRVYTNPDVIGCELAGALKNVIALASGMADGLGTGDNTRAAVITRGLAELSRLGVAMGGRAETFSGLAGMGDLVATCISTQSRNRYVGEQLGKGRRLDEVMGEMNQVAEGVKATAVIMQLAHEHGVDMPICSEMDAVVNQGRSPHEAYRGLLRRSPKPEHRER